MVKRFRNLIIILILFGISPIPLLGQQEGTPDYATRKITFYGFGGSKLKDVYWFPRVGKPELLAYQNWSKTVQVQYKGPKTFGLYRLIPGVDDEPPQYEIVASAEIPQSSKEVLVLVANKKSEGSTSQIELFAVDNDQTRFPAGTLCIYNTMKTTFASTVGGTKTALPPGLSQPIDLRELDDNYSNRFAVAAIIRDGPKIILDVDVNFAEGKRYLYILLPPRDPDSYMIQAIKIIDSPSSVVQGS